MDETAEIRENFVHLARIALSGRHQDIHAFLRRITKHSVDQELTAKVIGLLRKAPTPASPLRGTTDAMLPVDADSRHHLVQVDEHPYVSIGPFYEDSVSQTIARLIAERHNLGLLLQNDLEPTRTVLLTGPPGVGKTLTAKWIAQQLGVPLLTLDLSSVVSSYLGRTGANLRRVLDHAKEYSCILLLDELDAVAKRRDDSEEVGELKRLVTVLNQQLDDWPSKNLLVAATNHSCLLDPAIWRRFDEIIEFNLPGQQAICDFLNALLASSLQNPCEWSNILSFALSGRSFGDIERTILNARRASVLYGTDISSHFASLLSGSGLSRQKRTEIACKLVSNGYLSQRRAQEIVGVSRDTIRKCMSHSGKEHLE